MTMIVFVFLVIFCILYYIITENLKLIMKVFKTIVMIIWTLSLQNIWRYIVMFWKWLWSLTTVDEKAKAVANEVKDRLANAADEMNDVIDEAEDVVDALKGKSKKVTRKKK